MKKILFFENDENIFYAFNEILKREGFIGIQAKTEDEVLQKCWDENIQAIFYDVTELNQEEFEVIRTIHKLYSTIPIILISGQEISDQVNEFRKIDNVDCLEKPFSISALRASLHRMVVNQMPPAVQISRRKPYQFQMQAN